MRIVVTGRRGQVVQSLLERAASRADVNVVALGRPELDLAVPTSIEPAIRSAWPDVVVSAAAYTAVDQAEDEPDSAFAVNAVGAGLVAEAAAKVGAPVIHLSTDYVFSGTETAAHSELDRTSPRGAYAASKLAGEQRVAAANPHHLIVRTAWVYSPFGANFVKTMLRLAADRDEIAVVGDQWGNPTSAFDLADALLCATEKIQQTAGPDLFGIYHLAGSGETNWSGFARFIFEISRENGGPSARVKEIASSDYPTKARRPGNSRLSCQKFQTTFGWNLPCWQKSTAELVKLLVAPPLASVCNVP